MADTNEFLTADEVAAFLRLPRSTVYKLAQQKAIPGFKIGKHWRFRKDTFHAWLKKQESQNAEPRKLEN
jgi:excisionase family DNA binding protein